MQRRQEFTGRNCGSGEAEANGRAYLHGQKCGCRQCAAGKILEGTCERTAVEIQGETGYDLWQNI